MEMNPNQPQGQTKVPPPPTPEVSVRTMGSDIKSISQGEISPTPEVIAPRANFSAPSQSFVPEATGQMLSEEEAAPHRSRKGLWTVIILLIVLALIAVGYFIIYPMMSAPVAVPVVETPQPVLAEPVPVVASHTSAFSGAAIAVPQVTLKLNPVSRETIVQGLTDQQGFIGEGMTEVLLQDVAGGQLPLPTFLTALLPSFLDSQSAGTYATDDFTAYLYKDANGVWPGYVIPLKAEGAATLGQWLANLEKTDLGAFFVTAPGTLSAFKDGSVKGLTDRFATGTAGGASFSHAVTATDLHISTSYEGLKAALGALGY